MRALLLATAMSLALPQVAAAFAGFSRVDANEDGFVSYEEANRVMSDLKEITFRKFDKDSDGLLDRGEYAGLDNYYDVYRLN